MSDLAPPTQQKEAASCCGKICYGPHRRKWICGIVFTILLIIGLTVFCVLYFVVDDIQYEDCGNVGTPPTPECCECAWKPSEGKAAGQCYSHWETCNITTNPFSPYNCTNGRFCPGSGRPYVVKGGSLHLIPTWASTPESSQLKPTTQQSHCISGDARANNSCIAVVDPTLNKQRTFAELSQPMTPFGAHLRQLAFEESTKESTTAFVNREEVQELLGSGGAAAMLGQLTLGQMDSVHATSQAHNEARFRSQRAAEYISVASFAKATLELMVHGAPASLLSRALDAAQDELSHAKLCDIILMGRNWQEQSGAVNKLPEHQVPLAHDWQVLWDSTRNEGLINEAKATVELFKMALELVQDGDRPSEDEGKVALARVLWSIAEDEARHAELAWDTLKWISEASKGTHSFVVPSIGTMF